MWFLTLITWLAMILQIFLVTLAIAAALFYLAELIEEYTMITRSLLKIMLISLGTFCLIYQISCIIYGGLWIFEGFPFTMVVLGLFTNVVEFGLLRSFPFIQMSSPNFILTVALVLVNHYFAFQYFSGVYYSFSEIMAYFTLCLWVIPFTFFISLSAGDNVLPSTMQPLLSESSDHDVLSHYMSKGKKKRSVLLTWAEGFKNMIFPSRAKRF